jgi:SAM-dependent methyltransferase
MKDYGLVYHRYRSLGLTKALWVALRLIVLPSSKIHRALPRKGRILDIGCGNGGLTNYLAVRSPERNLIGVDYSAVRIRDAQKSVAGLTTPKFWRGDVTKIKLPTVKAYLIADVLHHINFQDQERLLTFLAHRLTKGVTLVIKDVNRADRLPFLFGHLFEKILYPKEKIYARSREEWERLFTKLGLKFQVEGGNWYFYDSTNIYTLSRSY